MSGYSDWKLPNARELQSLVDYSRAPDTTNSTAIDPLFNSTLIVNEAGDPAGYPTARGPQGDAIRIYNHVRLVRDTQR